MALERCVYQLSCHLTLTGINTYTGATTISAGTIKMSGAGTLGNSNGATNTQVTVNGTLDLNGTGQTIGLLSGSGTVDNTSASPLTLTVFNNTTSSSTFSGVISQTGGGAVNLTKFALGTLTLGGNNTFTGGVTIGNGEVKLASAGALNSTTPNLVTFNSNANTKTLTLNGNSVSVAGLSTGATVGTTTVQNNLAGAATLTINLGGSATYGGVLADGAAGTLALTKSGAGTQTLSGNNTFTGATSVSNGSLLLDAGSLSASSAVSVASGATFGGKGSAGAVSVTAGVIQGGIADTGSLSLTSLGFSGSSALNLMPVTGVASVAVSGAVTTSGTQTLNITNSTPLLPGAYSLVSYTSLAGDGIGAFVLGTTPFQPPAYRPRSYALDTATSPATYVGLTVLGDAPIWTGGTDGNWDTTTTGNWKLASDNVTATTYFPGDAVQFNDPTGTRNVIISGADVSPGSVAFNNSTGNDYTLSGSNGVAGSTGLSKSGTGKLTITNTNSYTGGTTVSGGTLELGDGATNGVIVGNIANTANVTFNNATAQSFSGNISGTGGTLTKAGTGTLILSGTNTYTNATTISAGTVSISATGNLGDASATNTIALSGGGRLNYTGTTAIDFGATRAISVGTGGGTLSHSGTTAVTMTVPGNLTGSGNLAFRTTGSGSGATTYSLTGTNSGYTGNISVEATGTILSTLTLANANAVPNAASITLNYPAASVTSGAATTLSLAGVTLPAGTTLNMTAFLNGAISLRSTVTSSGTSAINGPVTMTGNAGSVVQVTAGPGTLTLNGNITEASPGSFGGDLLFRGTGTTVVNGTINLPSARVKRTDAGFTTINSTGNVWAVTDVSLGTMKIGAHNALATMASLSVGQGDASAPLFDLNGFNQEVNGLTWLAGTANTARGVTNSISATQSTLTINSSNSYTFGASTGITGGILSGNLSLVKQGSGTQTLSGINTYTGGTTISRGTLEGQTNTAFGSAAITLGDASTGSENVALYVGNRADISNAVTVSALGTGSVTLGGSNTGSSTAASFLGTVTLNRATVFSGEIASDRLAFDGKITGSVGTLTVTGGARTTFSNTANDFVGDILVTGAGTILQASVATAAEVIPNGSSVTVDAGAVLQLASTSGAETINALNGAGTVRTFSGGTFGSGLRVGSADGSGTFSGVLENGTAGNPLTLTKLGAGTQTLSGVNTYTGGTTISAGTLLVSGSISGSTTTVNSGGTLGGSGTLGAVNVVGGTVAPGTSPGILSTGNFSLTGTSTLSIELGGSTVIAGTDYDQLSVAGTVNLGTATASLSVSLLGGFEPHFNDTFLIILNDGVDALTGSFAGISDGDTVNFGGYDFIFDSTFDGNGDTNLNDIALISQVPEPSSIMTLLAGLGSLAGLKRFRRRGANA